MCGIIAAEQVTKRIKSHVQPFIKRGPDQEQRSTVDSSYFIFNRLAIMGLEETGMQPFQFNEFTGVCNGEIYNYKSLIQKHLSKHHFTSTSDCEVLLPLFDLFSVEMFAMLDAEFAIVIYDEKTKQLIAGRDPIGIRPLFYGYDKETNKILFASEVKGILPIVKQVLPFPPGHYYIDGEFIQYTSLYDITKYHDHNLDIITKEIHDRLYEGVTKRLDSDAPIGFLLSGGLDSSLVCSIASKHLNQKLQTFSIGMKDDPIDLKYAQVVADYLGADHTEVKIDKDDIISCLEEVIIAFETYDITTIRAGIGMYLIAKYIHQNTDIKVLLTGEVSDELFGYKYTDFAPNAESFQQESIKRVKELYMYDVLRADRALACNSLEARVPFGDLDFVDYVLRISPSKKMNTYNMGKYLLREAFKNDYLPEEILYRDKAAFSDAVGHSLVDYLKEYAESYYSDEIFRENIQQYKTKPFSKESLLYREIFEKHYPNHSNLIPSYWMPNKEWKNCDVDDPSARVLKNYGKSGQ